MANLVLTCFRNCFETSGFHTTKVNDKDNSSVYLDTNFAGKWIFLDRILYIFVTIKENNCEFLFMLKSL